MRTFRVTAQALRAQPASCRWQSGLSIYPSIHPLIHKKGRLYGQNESRTSPPLHKEGRFYGGMENGSTPPTDEWAKREACRQPYGDKNSDFDAISLFFRKKATKSADLTPPRLRIEMPLLTEPIGTD